MAEKVKRPGAQPGNQNARQGIEDNDGQLLVRLPRERLPRMKRATYVTGDRGLNAMVRRLIDTELARVEAMGVR